jgi:ribosomal protein L24
MVQKAIIGLMNTKGLIEKPVRLEEIQHFLETKKARLRIDIDDTVEIVGGPFKGERGKIKRIDKVKDEVTIELLEASIPIPVTIATEFIKIVKKARPEVEEPAPASEIKLPEKEEEPEKKKFSMDELRKEMGEGEDEKKAVIEEERPREAIEEEAEDGEHLIKPGEKDYPPKEEGEAEPGQEPLEKKKKKETEEQN